MNCNQYSQNELSNFLAGESDADLEVALERHLNQCQECQQSLETLVGGEWWQCAATHLTDDEYSGHGFDVTQSSVSVVRDESRIDCSSVPIENSELQRLLDPPKHPEMLGRIGSFDVSEVIGQGGMGVVFKGTDPSLRRPVAIKVLAPLLASNAAARLRFVREGRAQRFATRHRPR